MASLVLELQSHAMDGQSSVTDLLRKVNAVSSKLKIDDVMSWARLEMNGYPSGSELPYYRRLKGELKALHPMHGHWMPVMATNLPASWTELPNRDSIAQIENHLESGNDGSIYGVQLSAEASGKLTQNFPVPIPVHLVISRSQLLGIVNTVRNKILDWSLELERDGILGNDLTFSREEQLKASNIVYHIGSVGVLGDVKGKNIQIGDHNSILEDLRKIGIADDQRAELKSILDGLTKAASPSDRSTWLEKGAKWVTEHKAELGLLYEGVRHLFSASGVGG